jgi:hypothetical protein
MRYGIQFKTKHIEGTNNQTFKEKYAMKLVMWSSGMGHMSQRAMLSRKFANVSKAFVLAFFCFLRVDEITSSQTNMTFGHAIVFKNVIANENIISIALETVHFWIN